MTNRSLSNPGQRPKINLYHGINPHLNSQLQQQGLLWTEFHDAHINHIRDMMNDQLVPRGYEARLVSGLQLSSLDPDEGTWDNPHPIQPDVAIRPYDEDLWRSPGLSASIASPLARPISEARGMTDAEYLNALALQKIGAPSTERPEAWIELLSRTNKPGGTHHDKYTNKFFGLLDKGIPIVELDYLHKSRPMIPDLPRYPKELGSHPYQIVVYDPRPRLNFEQGFYQPYPFDVEEAIPMVHIPFRNGDAFDFNFDAPYDFTLEKAYAWHINYLERPVDFNSYSRDDQQRTEMRMCTILEALRRGVDLSKQQEPLPVSCSPIEAHERLERLLGSSLDKPNNTLSLGPER